MKAEISETEDRKTIEKVDESKSQLFGKIIFFLVS